MDEYGIFNDEGLLEGDLYSHAEAEARTIEAYTDDDTHIAVVCAEHPEFEAGCCDICNEDDDSDLPGYVKIVAGEEMIQTDSPE